MPLTFFDTCPECKNRIPKGQPCPTCAPVHEDQQEDSTAVAEGLRPEMAKEYARCKRLHIFRYTIYILLMAGTAVMGMLTFAVLVLIALIGDEEPGVLFWTIPPAIGLLVLILTIRGFEYLYPFDLLCPNCDVRLDEIGLNGRHCPQCDMRLH